MKIVCKRNDLLKGVNIVSKAVPTRTTVTILECIKIDASSDNIVMTASDTQLSIETKIDGTIEDRGIIALDAKFFSDIVKTLTSDTVTIESDSNFHTKITSGKAKFETTGRSGEDFSPLPLVPSNNPIVISQLALRESILLSRIFLCFSNLVIRFSIRSISSVSLFISLTSSSFKNLLILYFSSSSSVFGSIFSPLNYSDNYSRTARTSV